MIKASMRSGARQMTTQGSLNHTLVAHMGDTMISLSQVRTQYFSLGGGGQADPEAIYNLYLILKVML
jgi:hypothetical protein